MSASPLHTSFNFESIEMTPGRHSMEQVRACTQPDGNEAISYVVI